MALVGGVTGIALTVLATLLFRKLFVTKIDMPFIFPALPSLLAQIWIGLGVTLLSVALATFIPAYRISHQDPAVAMRD